jgi:putative phosphoribosyl transferase
MSFALREKPEVLFADRREAGRELAKALLTYKNSDCVVLALPRGGVPVAHEIAHAIGAPLDIVLVRKIGAPGMPELGLGAIVDGAEPTIVLNPEVPTPSIALSDYLADEAKKQLEEIERRRELYRPDRPPLTITGRIAIIVDDGIATGGTMRATLRALSQAHPQKLMLAVPVASESTLNMLKDEADEIVCTYAPENFIAVGLYYADFEQTTDEEVIELLKAANERVKKS